MIYVLSRCVTKVCYVSMCPGLTMASWLLIGMQAFTCVGCCPATFLQSSACGPTSPVGAALYWPRGPLPTQVVAHHMAMRALAGRYGGMTRYLPAWFQTHFPIWRCLFIILSMLCLGPLWCYFDVIGHVTLVPAYTDSVLPWVPMWLSAGLPFIRRLPTDSS